MSVYAEMLHDALGREIRTFTHADMSLDYIACGAEGGRLLVLMQSVEYPGWPSAEFCDMAEAAGFRTVSIRRPGFGRVPAAPDLDRQAALVSAFLGEHGEDQGVIVCSGTSNALGYRLVGKPGVGLTVLANCCFNHDPMAEIRPDWFARSIQQTLSSVTGARLALMGFKSAEGIFGKYWVTENFMQKSPGDLDYLDRNRELFAEAMDCLHVGLDIHTFLLELRGTLKEDPVLTDGCFAGRPVVSISGMETSEAWKAAIRAEAERVGAPLHFFTSGDALVVHASAGEFIDLLQQYA